MRVLTIILTLLILAGCTGSGIDKTLARIDNAATRAMSEQRYGALDSLADTLLTLSLRHDNSKYEAKAHFYLASF